MDIVGVAVTRLTSRVPVLASERNTRVQYQDTDWPLRVTLRNFTRRHLATAIVANSEGGREYLERDVRVRAPVVVIKNGLDLVALDAVPPASVDALRRDGGPLLLYVGRLAPTKNPANLLRAMPEIASARPELRLLLCGVGPEEGNLKKLAGGLGVEASVEWMGYRADVWSLMKACDLLVHPAFTEGDPNVLAEAAAARLQLCVSDIPANREFTGGVSCAVFFDPRSPESIARTVLGALVEEPVREQRVAKARAIAETRSADRMAQSYEAVYRRLTASSR
jgi:glycosyltransferase involved in cell wall biosynthesis